MQDLQVTASIHAIESKVDFFRQEIESVNHFVNLFKRQIDELYSKPNVPVEFAGFRKTTEDFFKEVNDKFCANKLLVDGIRSVLDTLKSVVTHHDLMIGQVQCTIPAIQQQITDANDLVSQKIVSISTAFSNKFDAHADRQKKQLEDFSAQALTAPKSVIETNKSIADKIDIALLESSNAIAKMCNLEQTLKMLDRKLDALAIQVKKVELAQQV
jgi:hypothetical protein